jgi:hypothetical protein
VRIGQLLVKDTKKAGIIGGLVLITLVSLIIAKLLGIAADQMADKPVEPGTRVSGHNDPPGALTGSLSGSSLPGSRETGSSPSSFISQSAPVGLDKINFHGVWVRPDFIADGVSRVVFVQNGSSVTGRVEIAGAMHGEDGKILIPSGTYDLTGAIDADNKLSFTFHKFTGHFTIARTGMTMYGFMNAPGGRYLGYAVTLERQLVSKT